MDLVITTTVPQCVQSVQDLALQAVYYFSESPRQGLYSLGQPETAWRYPQGLNRTEEQRRQRKEQEREEG